MKRKKVLTLLLAAMMTASMTVPAAAATDITTASGEEVLVGADTVIKQTQKDISQEMYKLPMEGCDTLQLTSDAVIKGQALTLNTYYMPNVTIDLNGHNLSIENFVNINPGGTFTIIGEGTVTGTENIKEDGGVFVDKHTESTAAPTAKPTAKPSVAPTGTPGTVDDGAVAAIGDETFDSLQDAVDACRDSRKIRLLRPVDITETGLNIPASKKVTLDLAEVNANPTASGKKTVAILTGTGEKGITIEGGFALTDTDNIESVIATKDDSEDAIFTVKEGGAFCFMNGYIDATGTNSRTGGSHAVIAGDHTKVRIKAADRDHGTIIGRTQSTIVLNDESSLDMTGGTLRSLDGVVIESHTSNVVRIGSDSYLRSGEAAKSTGNHVITADNGTVAVAGGIFRTDSLITCISGTDNAKIRLAGGYYKQDVPADQIVNNFVKTKESIVEDNSTGIKTSFYGIRKSPSIKPSAVPSGKPSTAPTTTPKVTPTSGAVDERFGTVYTTNLSLKGKVGLNAYLILPERIMNDKDATIEITRNDKKEVIPVADLEAFDLKGKPVVTVSTYVTAKEMSDPIGISVISGDGHKLPLKDTAGNKSRNGAYSISVYTLTLQMSNNASVSKDLKKLYTTLGNYGVYAQLYFKHNDEKVKILDDLSDVKTSVFDSYKAKTSGSLSGVKFVGGNLILDADTTLMTYFYSKKDLSKYTFQIDGRTVTPEKDGDYYILTLDGIEAKNLDKTYAFSVSDGKNKLTANYSALSYAQSTIASKNESLINLMKAMYKYNAAANVYFKS